MKLGSYLDENDISLDAFAKRIGVSHGAVVWKYVNDKRIPHPRIMAAIVRETGGAVQPNDFFAAAA